MAKKSGGVKHKGLHERIKHVGEEAGVGTLAAIGIKHSGEMALHHHMYQNDHHYRRSTNAFAKARNNALKRVPPALVKQLSKGVGVAKQVVKGVKA